MRLVFDRGTVLLLDAANDATAAHLPGMMWDPRVGAFRAPAWRHPDVVSALAGRGVRHSDDVAGRHEPPGTWREFELRGYQRAALAAWAGGNHRGVVVLPTGSGKTRVGLAALAEQGVTALVMVPTRVLLDQWHQEIAAVFPHPVGRLGDGHRDLTAITVATYESAYRHMSELGNRFGLLVIDEAHHFGVGMRDEALEMSTAPARLGLTATPVRDGAAAAGVARLIGPTIYELTIADLAGTYLADFEIASVRVDLTPEERDRYDRLIAMYRSAHAQFQRLAPGSTWAEFASAAVRTTAGRAALRAWREARRLVSLCDAKRSVVGNLLAGHRGARILIFVADNDAAYAIARDHLVMPLTCDIGRSERADALERFRAGHLRVLVSARVLNEGLDVPSADIAIIVSGSQGEREHVQRVGRLLRPAPGKRALVYELIARGTIDVGQAARRSRGLVARRAADLPNPF
jgi:superfamily II DNA or RNA helicase